MIPFSIIFLFALVQVSDAACLHIIKSGPEKGEIVGVTDSCPDQPYQHDKFVIINLTNVTKEQALRYTMSYSSHTETGELIEFRQRLYKVLADTLPANVKSELANNGYVKLNYTAAKIKDYIQNVISLATGE